ncbi:hypothetical protein [Ereboglobus luteus]|nr:hypothetical protein [Ereboglobus luteus]
MLSLAAAWGNGGFLQAFISCMKVPLLDLSIQHKTIREEAFVALAATY